jgi:hypothetical protein
MGMTLLDDAMVQFSLLWAAALLVALISTWLRGEAATPGPVTLTSTKRRDYRDVTP